MDNENQKDMKAKGYLTEIRSQVRAGHNGEVPKELELTIRNYAAALELRDRYRETVMNNPVIIENNTSLMPVTKQHPLCGLLYQQESVCQQYAKMLGLTAAKAAVKTEPVDKVADNDPMLEYYKKKQ